MIITSIKFQNFFSFKDEAAMNFCVNQKVPQTNHFGSCEDGRRFNKVSAIFGANASGKTNIIIVFDFLQWFIVRSFFHSDEGFSKFIAFKTMNKKSSTFEVEFYIEDILYKFSLKIDKKRVLSEMLESRKNKRLIKLYSREYISSNNSYKFEAKNISLEDNFIEKVRSNASVISTARQYNHPELTKVRNHWADIFKKSKRPPFLEDSFLFLDFNHISEFYSENKNYFSQAKDFLKQADLGLSDIRIEPRETGKEDSRGNMEIDFYPYGIHTSKSKKFELPFPLESGGTQHLYTMLRFIFPALTKGSVCLIDEIECNLHPNILPAIVNLFTAKETNPKNAQLICTTHMPTLMSDLSKSQIFLVEKNQECESEVYRLDEVEGVRSDDNILKKYLAGSYGGVPDIDM